MSKSNNMSNQSQLLLRSEDHFAEGKWAFVNPPDASVFSIIDNDELIGLHQFHHHYSECERASNNNQIFAAAFGDDVFGKNLSSQNHSLAKHSLDGVVIFMPKSKQQLAMLIDNASYLVKPNASVLVLGENKAGIKSVGKMLEKVGAQVNKIDSAKHCALYAVNIIEPLNHFDINDYSLVHDYTIHGQTLKIFSLPGVFGHKQIDPGTEILLEQLSPASLAKTRGHIYDFACGTGIIGCYLAKAISKTKVVTMSDISALAVYCAEQSARLNEVDAEVIACAGVAQHERKFDMIVSNPPFHEGIQQDYSITENFIKQAFSRSHQYASMTIVANRFLPYPDILDAVYKGFTEVAASNKFRVYGAKKFAKQ